MIQAFAPRLPRGCSWVMLVICGLAWTNGVASGQETPKAAPAPAPGPAPAVKPEDEAKKVAKTQRFMDPNAKAAIGIFDPIFYRGKDFKGSEISRMLSIATGLENDDPEFVRNYIDYFASQLSNRDNINALLGQPPNLSPTSNAARGMERAVDALTRPLVDARATPNRQTFLRNYTQALFASALPKLTTNNYFTRIDAMIVLGMAGGTSPTALDFYASQIKLPDQVLWVKMWAARGYSNASQEGRRPIEFSKAISGADALLDLLSSDAKIPYFVLFRCFEALGSLRVAVVKNAAVNLDVASVLARYVADSSVHPEARAYAAWALGMVRVPSQVSPYNFSLAGSAIGHLAVDLAHEIIAQYDAHASNFSGDQMDESSLLTALLMFQVIPALGGEEAISDSGLVRSNHPDVNAVKPFLTSLDEKIRSLTREAYDLLRVPPNNQKAKRDALDAKIKELTTFLDANKPKTRQLVPNGPQIADDAGAK